MVFKLFFLPHSQNLNTPCWLKVSSQAFQVLILSLTDPRAVVGYYSIPLIHRIEFLLEIVYFIYFFLNILKVNLFIVQHLSSIFVKGNCEHVNTTHCFNSVINKLIAYISFISHQYKWRKHIKWIEGSLLESLSLSVFAVSVEAAVQKADPLLQAVPVLCHHTVSNHPLLSDETLKLVSTETFQPYRAFDQIFWMGFKITCKINKHSSFCATSILKWFQCAF